MRKLQEAIKAASAGQKQPFAAFDFDNTCIVNDIAEATLAYLCRHRLLKDQTLLPPADEDYHRRVFRHYYALLERSGMEDAYVFSGQVFAGFTPAEVDELVDAAISAEGAEIGRTELHEIQIAKGLAARPKVLELLAFLQEQGVEAWVISASPEEVVRAAMRRFRVPGQLIGLRNVIRDGKLTKEIIRPHSIAAGKVDCIKTYIHPTQQPLLGAGDSMNDFPMLEYSSLRAVIDRNNALTKEARARDWFIL